MGMSEKVLPNLNTSVFGRKCLHFSRINSTNDYLKEHGASLPGGTLVIADEQFAGRGRLGKNWSESRPKDGLAMSLLLRPTAETDFGAVPLCVGLATAIGTEKTCGTKIQIKWPNDVLINGKKICGILCEAMNISDSPIIICGIGINLSQPQSYFDSNNLPFGTSVYMQTGEKPDMFETAAAVMNEFEPIWNMFCESGFSALRDNYKKYCVTIGKDIKIIGRDGERTGKASDINDDGSLAALINGERVSVNSGEVSVRGLYGYI